jgi:hypothetical protein
MNDIQYKLLENEYATKDLYFAAFLHVKGINIKKLEKYGGNSRDQRPVYFIFGDKRRCERLEGIFWNGVGSEIMVNIKDFTTAVRDLRARANSVSNVVHRLEEETNENN